jgi:hypothetical protein
MRLMNGSEPCAIAAGRRRTARVDRPRRTPRTALLREARIGVKRFPHTVQRQKGRRGLESGRGAVAAPLANRLIGYQARAHRVGTM